MTKHLFSQSDGISRLCEGQSRWLRHTNFQDRFHHTIFRIDPILLWVYCQEYYLRFMVHGKLDLWLFYTFWVFTHNYSRVLVYVIHEMSYPLLVVIVRSSVVHQRHTISKFFVSYLFIHVNLLCAIMFIIVLTISR